MLNAVAEKSDPRLVLADSGEHQSELRTRQEFERNVDADKYAQRHVIEPHTLGNFVVSQRQSRK